MFIEKFNAGKSEDLNKLVKCSLTKCLFSSQYLPVATNIGFNFVMVTFTHSLGHGLGKLLSRFKTEQGCV